MIFPLALQINAVTFLHGFMPTGSTSSDVTFQYSSNSSTVVRNSLDMHDCSRSTSVSATNRASSSESIGGAPGRGSDSATETFTENAKRESMKKRIADCLSKGCFEPRAEIIARIKRTTQYGQRRTLMFSSLLCIVGRTLGRSLHSGYMDFCFGWLKPCI